MTWHKQAWSQSKQPVSRPVELVHYFAGWVEGASKRTDRTDCGCAQSTFGAKAANKTGGASRHQTPVLKSEKFKCRTDLEISVIRPVLHR